MHLPFVVLFSSRLFVAHTCVPNIHTLFHPLAFDGLGLLALFPWLCLQQGVSALLDQILGQVSGLEAIIISDRDGITIAHHHVQHFDLAEEKTLATTFADFGEQANKMTFGATQSITTFFNDRVVVHVNDAPLLYTFVGQPDLNAGLVLAIVPELKQALSGLRATVDRD